MNNVMHKVTLYILKQSGLHSKKTDITENAPYIIKLSYLTVPIFLEHPVQPYLMSSFTT